MVDGTIVFLDTYSASTDDADVVVSAGRAIVVSGLISVTQTTVSVSLMCET